MFTAHNMGTVSLFLFTSSCFEAMLKKSQGEKWAHQVSECTDFHGLLLISFDR